MAGCRGSFPRASAGAKRDVHSPSPRASPRLPHSLPARRRTLPVSRRTGQAQPKACSVLWHYGRVLVSFSGVEIGPRSGWRLPRSGALAGNVSCWWRLSGLCNQLTRAPATQLWIPYGCGFQQRVSAPAGIIAGCAGPWVSSAPGLRCFMGLHCRKTWTRLRPWPAPDRCASHDHQHGGSATSELVGELKTPSPGRSSWEVDPCRIKPQLAGSNTQWGSQIARLH